MEEKMKLIFKYKSKEYRFSKEYIKICISSKITNKIPLNLDDENYYDRVKKNNLLQELYLSDYFYDTDLALAEYVLDKLNDENVDDYDISSQGYDVELKKDKVIFSEMYSSEEDNEVSIDRKEVAYAMLKWKLFLEREIDNPNYQEIIDTEDVYKE